MVRKSITRSEKATHANRRFVRLPHLPGVLTAAALLALVPAAANAQQPPAQSLQEDARAYAAEFNVGVDEAMRRLRAQEQQGDIVDRLRKANPGRFAGLWVEHQPEFRIVVRLAGDAPAPPEFASAAAGSPSPVVFVTGAAATESQVLGKIQASRPQFRTALPGLVGTDMDVKTGDIVLYVHATGAAGETARAKGAELARLVGHPVRVEVLNAPAQDGNVRGAANLSNCTTGFVVQNSAGTRGVLTAGHCPDAQTYSGFDGTNTTLSFVSEIRDADQDVQWHTSTLTELPEFYADLTTSARVLTGRRYRTSTAPGNAVCHRGKSTGYSCGTVQSITFQPDYTDACPGTTCSNVWISVAGPNLKCYPGDSGGAWFNGQTAFGIYKGQSSAGPAVGDCSLAWYMSTDFISGLGVSLLYGT
jgi:hypothetical protein